MNRSLVAAAAMALCIGMFMVLRLSAQQPAGSRPVPPVASSAGARPTSPAGSPTGTALVDTAVIGQDLARLKKTVEDLKAEFDGTAVSLKKEGELGNQMVEKLRQMPANSPDRKPLEQEILKKRADFDLRGKRLTEEYRDREMKLYYGVFKELNEELARYAQSKGIQLILRFDSAPLELSDPRAVMAEIQKLVVYQRGADVTPAIIEAMNRRGGSAGSTTRAPAQSRPSQLK